MSGQALIIHRIEGVRVCFFVNCSWIGNAAGSDLSSGECLSSMQSLPKSAKKYQAVFLRDPKKHNSKTWHPPSLPNQQLLEQTLAVITSPTDSRDNDQYLQMKNLSRITQYKRASKEFSHFRLWRLWRSHNPFILVFNLSGVALPELQNQLTQNQGQYQHILRDVLQ